MFLSKSSLCYQGKVEKSLEVSEKNTPGLMLFPSKGLGCAEGAATPWPWSTSCREGGPCWDGLGAAGVGGSANTSRTNFFSMVSGQQQAKCLVRWMWGACRHTCTHINMDRLTDRAVQTHTHTHIYLYAPGIPLPEGKDVQCVLVHRHPNSCALQNLSTSVLGQCLAAAPAYCNSFFFCEKGYLNTENVKLIIASSITVKT